MRFLIFAAATLLMILPATAQDKATIEKLNNAFVSAFKKGDFAAVGSMYAEDAIALPPGSPIRDWCAHRQRARCRIRLWPKWKPPS